MIRGTKHSEEAKIKISLALSQRVIKDSTRKKLADAKRGNKTVFWKGGISKENELARKSLEYRIWRTAVFKRDGYACVIGGKPHGKNLQADHIKTFAKFKKLRYVVSNGRTLCIECHKKTDTYGKN